MPLSGDARTAGVRSGRFFLVDETGRAGLAILLQVIGRY